MDLVLRPWRDDDAPALREAIDEDLDHLRPWLSWTLEEPASLERTHERIARWIDQHRSQRAFRYAITPADRPQRVLGGANFHMRFGPMTRGIGYWVRASAARQGIAGAAVSALLVEAFEVPEVDKVIAQCNVDNTASEAFARSLGFEVVDEVQGAYADGTPRRMLELSLPRVRYAGAIESACLERALRVRIEGGPPIPSGTARTASS